MDSVSRVPSDVNKTVEFHRFLTTGAGLSWMYLQNCNAAVVAALIFSTRPFLNRLRDADSYVEHNRL